ncbi:hypothetical protein GNI_180890 [Gregarina niphandrodes]|uniref:Uncharacterized protein n=1 Tax=Gregarina niphandrodes TaxID=110365 RepID=A0A023AWW1_GRENI|nr:hypothetical protein GNI_180890 [Gregarina niphandrodes]EZG43236.1 hypothetical protein GNI_180890 [Gregarina niphandrodes]|eukprot:XP_011133504.1 hypothetical protein GNI_180890 [Gregarina niphandrodes]
MTGGEWTVAKSRHRTKGSSEWSGGTPMRFQYYNTVGDLDAAVNASRQRTVLRSLTETITQAARNRFPDAVDISVIGVGIGSLCRNKASIEQWALFAHVCDALAREYKQVNRVISEPDLSELDISFMQSRSTRIVTVPIAVQITALPAIMRFQIMRPQAGVAEPEVIS